MKFGMAIAAKMPMIATTIINSMSVKPFCPCTRVNMLSLLVKNDCADVRIPGSVILALSTVCARCWLRVKHLPCRLPF